MFLKQHDADQDTADTLGGRIVHAREAQELTTSQLARRLGVRTATLNAWETDRAEPRSNRLLMLAGMLNVSPTWLLTGSGERPVEGMSETEMMHLRSTVERLREQALTLADELEQLETRLDSYQSYER